MGDVFWHSAMAQRTSSARMIIVPYARDSYTYGNSTRIDSQTILMSSETGRQTASASLSSFDQSNTLFVTVRRSVS